MMEIVVGLGIEIDAMLDGITAWSGRMYPALPGVPQRNHHRARVANTLAVRGVLITRLSVLPWICHREQASLSNPGRRLHKDPPAPVSWQHCHTSNITMQNSPITTSTQSAGKAASGRTVVVVTSMITRCYVKMVTVLQSVIYCSNQNGVNLVSLPWSGYRYLLSTGKTCTVSITQSDLSKVVLNYSDQQEWSIAMPWDLASIPICEPSAAPINLWHWYVWGVKKRLSSDEST